MRLNNVTLHLLKHKIKQKNTKKIYGGCNILGGANASGHGLGLKSVGPALSSASRRAAMESSEPALSSASRRAAMESSEPALSSTSKSSTSKSRRKERRNKNAANREAGLRLNNNNSIGPELARPVLSSASRRAAMESVGPELARPVLSSASRRAAMESVGPAYASSGLSSGLKPSASKTRRKQRREENAANREWELRLKNNNSVGNIVDVDYSVKLYHQLHDNKGLRTQFKSFMEELPIMFHSIYVIDNENGVYVNFGERSTLSIHNGNYDITGKSKAAIRRARLAGNMHVHFKEHSDFPEKYIRISISNDGKKFGFHSITVLEEQEKKFVKKIIKLIKRFIKLHPWTE